jgi:maltooligosyltrehalose trehalohydrolase
MAHEAKEPSPAGEGGGESMRRIGARYTSDGNCEFRVWAPLLDEMSVHIVSSPQRVLPLRKDEKGFFSGIVEGMRPKDRYLYRVGNRFERPDPASHYQPDGVEGPSAVVDHSAFAWRDQRWPGLALEELVIYELHVGTFSPDGTFAGVAARLDYLQGLGVNALEIMPVAQFPGARSWGYDGVFPFAVQNSYGGPDGLKTLVDECHLRSMSVILDVVYNHFGPEGNVLLDFMPCFTDTYKTPWGKAINFDGAYSDGVRDFFIENALHWFENYHIDALRLDAIHGIFDKSAKHVLAELSEKTAELSRRRERKYHLIAESDLNDVRVVEPFARGGYGIDAQWNDDFHHCIHVLLTGEREGYYADFGAVEQLAKAVRDGFVYSWDYSKFRKRHHGSSSARIPASRFVVFSQNHDQVGNRWGGERLSSLVGFEALKVAAGLVLLSANIPLLFMGEEYGEEAPFLYFVSFRDAGLIEAVREGRRKEHEAFARGREGHDPSEEATFRASQLRWDAAKKEKARALLGFYRRLIRIRRNQPAIRSSDKSRLRIRAEERDRTLSIVRFREEAGVCLLVNLNDTRATITSLELEGEWRKIVDSSDAEWLGPGSGMPYTLRGGDRHEMQPFSLVAYRKEA